MNAFMPFVHQYTSKVPFDLFELHLLHLVAEHGSFTKAGKLAGLTQSAITRQIQGMERRIGFPLLERTTRRVSVTPVGDRLLEETRHILGDIESSLRRLHEEFSNAPKEVRVGVSKTVGLAYFPGFFFAHGRKFPEVGIKVRHESSTAIIESLELGDLDAAVISAPDQLPDSLTATHRFRDAFTLIAPATDSIPPTGANPKELWKWLNQHKWLLIDRGSGTGSKLRRWLERQGGRIQAASEMDNFDLIIHLVALGLGIGLVPQRALASFPRKKLLRQISLPKRFSRELVVLIRKSERPAEHVTRFVENILF
jgi:DNA-binding transcriptional LysR family regulator